MSIPSSKDLGSPIFITSLALSPANAIGVQAKNFSRLWPRPWRHCYWDTCTGLSTEKNSVLLKNSLPDRWPFVKGRGFMGRQLEKMNLCWWRGDSLLEKRKARLAELFQDSNVAYVAPLWAKDAVRSVEVLRVLGIPYVVHLWDVMDRDGLHRGSRGYSELLSGAGHIFCVSSAIEDDVRKICGKPVSLLSFTRPDSKSLATQPPGPELRIAISGHLAPYKHGLELLAAALPGLDRAFAKISIRYIGPNDQAAMLPESLSAIAVKSGFVDDATRDRLLAECNVGFLPGPLLDTSDMRSRYSIPSRMADYYSVGLPIVGAVYETSAVNLHFRNLAGTAFQRVSNPSELLSALTAMREEKFWRLASQSARNCFVETMSEEVVLGHLESVIAELFSNPSSRSCLGEGLDNRSGRSEVGGSKWQS
jgi:hypothetical protein